MTRYLLAAGVTLVVIVGAFGGWAAAIGGATALTAQLGAVALLKPAMTGPQPQFMRRWLGGMAIRTVSLALLLTFSATHRQALPVLPASLGFLGVLLPLLVTEARFLR